MANKKSNQYQKTSYSARFVNLTTKVYVRAAILLVVVGCVLGFLVKTSQPVSPTTAGSTHPFPAVKTGDVNGDGVVDQKDIQMILDNWGSSDKPSDLNHDGIVNQEDIQIVLNNWGK